LSIITTTHSCYKADDASINCINDELLSLDDNVYIGNQINCYTRRAKK